MIRILAGEKKGHVLRVARTAAVRPTAANARQVLFDILGGRVDETRWLDLYAGSGAVGLEALSRGATGCVLIESSRRCLAVIRDNIKRLGYRERCRLIEGRVTAALKKLAAGDQTFDVIFLDPPYRGDEAERCLLALGRSPASSLLDSSESLVVAQLPSRGELRATYGCLTLDRERKLGDTRLCFFHREPDQSAEPTD